MKRIIFFFNNKLLRNLLSRINVLPWEYFSMIFLTPTAALRNMPDIFGLFEPVPLSYVQIIIKIIFLTIIFLPLLAAFSNGLS